MGGCISNHASSKETSKLVLKILAEVNSLPATSSETTAPQQWKRLFHSLVPVTLTYTQEEGDVYVYRVSASGVDGSTFTAYIRVPGTELHKISPCFIQWSEGGEGGEGEGALWGLNFMSEDDAMKFLKGCTPPTLTPESKKKRYSIPITLHHISPPPPPPSQDHTHHLSDSFESLEESDTHSNHEEFDSHSPVPDTQHGNETVQVELETTDFATAIQPCAHTTIQPDTVAGDDAGSELIGGSPPNNENQISSVHTLNDVEKNEQAPAEVRVQTPQIERGQERGDDSERNSELVDVEGDDEGSEGGTPGETPTLYEPTSPLHLMPTGILHDIAEETEGDTECEHSWNTRDGALGSTAGNEIISGDVEYAETGFFENPADGDITHNEVVMEVPPTPGVAPPPSLPVSPPPGPVLSPRLSMLLAESAAAKDGTLNNARPLNQDLTNRLSVASTSGDSPPPLPSSLPPGKLISPRNSLMDPIHGAHPVSIPSSMGTRLDIALLSLADVSNIEDGKKFGSNDLVPEIVVQNRDREPSPEPNKDIEIESNNDNEEPLLITTIDEVDDPLDEEPLPPPVEDDETPTHIPGGARLKITPSFLRSLEPPREFSDSGFPDTDHAQSSTPEQVGDKDGSSITVSDERTTECSGSATIPQSSSVCTGDGEGRGTEGEGEGEEGEEEDDKLEGGVEREEGGRVEENLHHTPAPTTTRKTGWLELKTMLVRKNRKVAMKSKRKWRRFWATLKGCSLLFSVCEDNSSGAPDDMLVDTKLDLSLSLAHAVHDHVKRDYIICLSTANGNTYYLQTTSVSEMEDWIAAIHSAAAVAMTNNTNKEGAIQTIKSEIEELTANIEKETQLKNLTALNLTTVTDYNARAMASKQLVTCAENIERYNVEIYRLRCYMASLHGSELPNPQTLLASISKPTKLALGKVGVFSVASLHAIVSARSIPASSSSYSTFKFGRPNRPTFSIGGKGKNQKHKSFPRTGDKKSPLRRLEISGPYPMLPAATLHSLAQSYSEMEETTDTEVLPFSPESHPPLTPVLKVVTPGNRVVPVALHDDITIEDVLHMCCKQRKVEVKDHFVRLRRERSDGEFECEIPHPQDLLQNQEYTHVELCLKWTHTVLLSQPDQQNSANAAFGVILEPNWDSGGNRLETVMVSRVEEGGVADHCGVWEGDEVVRVNGRPVKEAGWVGTRSALDAPSVSLTLKTCHIEMPVSEVTNQIVESLICPAPPSSNTELSSEAIRQLTVPTPTREAVEESPRRYSGTFSREHIDTLLKDSHDLSKLLRSWDVQRAREDPSSSAAWTQEDRLRKSAQDLIDTERDYVRLLHLLVERYLEPLQSETFLSHKDREALEGNTLEVLEFQTMFLQGLEEAMSLEMQSSNAAQEDRPLKHVLFAIAGTFLVYMENFRMYSTFCASHHKIKQLLDSGECIEELKEFLEARNPRNDHTLTLPALFAKPIVRLSRYPLFLNAMIENSPADSEERSHLTDVVEGMTSVANYINEMQRVSETYSSLFHTILLESAAITHQLPELNLSVTQLDYHGEVMWLNPGQEEHRAIASSSSTKTSWKKGQGPQTTCFVFAAAVVLVRVERKLRRRASIKNLEVEVGPEDTKFRILLPTVYCSVHDLPDSDGVTNMWQLKYRPSSSPPVHSSPSLTSPPSSSPQTSYLLRSQSKEQKASMVDLIRQSIREQCGTSGSNSPIPPPSPYHNSHPSPSPLHHAHSSQRHCRPRSNSQPHLPHYTPSLHPSPLSHSHLPSLPSLHSLTDS